MQRETKGKKILVLDDEPDMLENLDRILRNAGFETVTLSESERAEEVIEHERPDLLLTDMRMPKRSGMMLLQLCKEAFPDLPVIVMTAYASIESAVETVKEGAEDYIVKPFSPQEIVLKVKKALKLRDIMEENRRLKSRLAQRPFKEIIGNHPRIREVIEEVKQVAPLDCRVLLLGESGTGKGLLAETIHHHSPRKHGPFYPLNCGALPDSLLESELFGHEKGAFTGAVAPKRGFFEVARGGTLFLDEIAETSPMFQIKLLQVVEKGIFFRVGSTRPVKTNVRLIAATNRDLHREVEAGRFREDLYYRLSVVTIRLPPLRERISDIPQFVEHFLQSYASQLNKKIRGISPEAMEILKRYPWPGNVRELQNIVERAVIMARPGETIAPAHLPSDLVHRRERPSSPLPTIEEAERELILQALEACNWNRTLAAKRLGIGRRTLYDKLSRLGISLNPPR